tara:strand:+ start:1368 stop:1796 length:429 start_codon:yes stop_codon:yes gene_type:complete
VGVHGASDHPAEYVQFRAVFPDGTDTSSFSFGALILTNTKTGDNYLLEFAGFKNEPDAGIYISKFKPRAGRTDAFAEMAHDINFKLTPEMLLSRDSIESVCHLETVSGVKPDIMALIVDLSSLGGKTSIIKTSYIDISEEAA